MKRFLAALLFFAALATPSRAQFIGYTSPQTVSSTPFPANTSCTGSQQVARVSNLGQTVHAAFLIGNILSNGKMTIQGTTDGVNFFDLSDPAELGNGTGGVSLVASGYYPIVQIAVTCNTGGNFQVTYAGTSVTPGVPLGTQALTQYAKSLARIDPSNTTANYTFQVPYGNSGGTLYFNYAGANGPAGSTLTVLCQSPQSFSGGQGITVLPATTIPTVTAGWQHFPVSANNCSNVSVTYTTGGASAGSFALDYVFSFSGQATGIDPCQSPSVLKSSVVITAPAAATTQIIPGVAGQQIFACGYNLGVVVAVAGTVQWTTGTGGTCGASTVTKTGAIPVNTAEPFSYGPASTLFTAAAGSGVCITLTGAGDNAAGIITFVQQ